MKKTILVTLISFIAFAMITSSAAAFSLGELVAQGEGHQDTWLLDDWDTDPDLNHMGVAFPLEWHELGVNFPIDEQITASWAYTNTTSCTEEPYDNPGIQNVLLSITNNSQKSWVNLHYVADSGTSITNYDGRVGNTTEDWQLAFSIDHWGVNTPLVNESTFSDLIFAPGETWDFILQDFGSFGLPGALGSQGITGNSVDQGLSTGSIIAMELNSVPIPSAIWLLGSGMIGLVGFRKKFKKA